MSGPSSATVITGGFYDAERLVNPCLSCFDSFCLPLSCNPSGVKEYWIRMGSDDSVCARDFGTKSTWQNATQTVASHPDVPLPEQSLSMDLAAAFSENWSRVYFAVAVVNHAYTVGSDTSKSVTYACALPISLVSYEKLMIWIEFGFRRFLTTTGSRQC